MLALSALLYSRVADAAATPTCSPTFTDANGKVWAFDYNGMTQQPIGGTMLQGEFPPYYFSMNICADMQDGECTGMICQFNQAGQWVANLGYWDADLGNGAVAKYAPINPENLATGLSLTFENDGECFLPGGGKINRTTEVNFVCEEEGVEIPTVFDVFENPDAPCEYTISVKSQANCNVDFVCHDAPCKNQGICIADPRDETKFSCECTSLYYGLTCELEDPCYQLPCQNGGTCYPTGTSVGNQGNYECRCLDAYEGKNCQTIIPCDEEDPWKGWGVFCLVMFILTGAFTGVRYIAGNKGGGGLTGSYDSSGTYQS